MISIIIPALNEEQYLPLLLESIKRQDYKDYEIIVADASSKDKTVDIALGYHCKVVKGGMPAKGKNEGAKVANGELLFFVDSDIILPNDFLINATKEFKKRRLDIASSSLIILSHKKFMKFLIDLFYNKPAIFLEKTLPHSATGTFIKKTLFEKLHGFDENVKLAEDHDLARRAKKIMHAKFGIIRSTNIFVSDRRFKKDGWLRTGFKYLFCEIHMMTIGPVKSDIFNYKFNHYKKNK